MRVPWDILARGPALRFGDEFFSIGTLTYGEDSQTGYFAKSKIELGLHHIFDHRLELSLRGASQWVSDDTPIDELVSIGGGESVRGFADDHGLGSTGHYVQGEVWVPFNVFGDQLERILGPTVNYGALSAFVDGGAVSQPVGARSSGVMSGAGLGLRYDVGGSVIRGDWAYGFLDTVTDADPTGRFYITITSDFPFKD